MVPADRLAMETRPVDVIVPVYGGGQRVRRCIESVLGAPVSTPFDVIVIDDASPEPELVGYLEGLAAEGRINLLRNATNLGFVRTVNRGMMQHPDRDVVLLNSDTEVANDWLDRLQRCVRCAPDIGTATPFSNNATVCSYPDFCADNAVPAIGLAALDEIFSRTNAGETVELPTAVGFCMYIRRACLNAVGLFDAIRFGRGYGEENDFSRRAAKAGWRNVLCADVYVYHAGGVSFAEERGRLMDKAATVLSDMPPEYEALVEQFVSSDPPAEFRRRVDLELVATLAREKRESAGNPARAVQLHIVHDLGGGVAQWVEDYCRADKAGVNLILKPFCQGPAYGEGLLLYQSTMHGAPVGFWRFSKPIAVCEASHPEYREALSTIIKRYNVGVVFVSSLIGHALDPLDTGLPTAVINHDFFPFCPTINLHFGDVCTGCDDTRLAECAHHNPLFKPFAHFDVEHRLAVRAAYFACIGENDIVLCAPTEIVRRHLRQVFPSLKTAPFVVIPHGCRNAYAPIVRAPASATSKLQVVVLGLLPTHKGGQLLRDAMDRLVAFADVHLVGVGEFGEAFRDVPGVHIVERYERESLPEILVAIQPDVGLLPSIVPETYSYALTELFQLGIPPVATRLGAFAERIQSSLNGWLFEPDACAMVECLRSIHLNRKSIAEVRTRLPTMAWRTAGEMVADYQRLLAVEGSEEAACRFQAMPSLEGAERDRADLALAAASRWKAEQGLQRRYWLAQHRLEAMRHHLHASTSELAGLKAQLEEADALRMKSAGALQRCTEDMQSLRASTSWRISRPLRWLGGKLRQAGQVAYGLADQAVSEASPAAVSAQSASENPELLEHIPSGAPATSCQDVRTLFTGRISAMPSPPLISVLVVTFNAPASHLERMLASLRDQFYPHWQLCVVDDGSTQSHVAAVLKDFAQDDHRVVLELGGAHDGISVATNRALGLASGDFCVLLEQDAWLEPQALFRIAETALGENPDWVYSDEILVDHQTGDVKHYLFRPAFSPEYLRSCPVIVNQFCFRTEFLRRLGGLNEELAVSQYYDLALRASEIATKIAHIPEVLCCRRETADLQLSVERGDTNEANASTLKNHLSRCGEKGWANRVSGSDFMDVRYPLRDDVRVAILIPTRNRHELVQACIESLDKTLGDIPHDIVLIDHDSDDPEAKAYFSSLAQRVTLLRYTGAFNFSAINNWATAQLRGEYSHYLFCNNDIEALRPGWLERMLELGQKKDVGIVGAKLCYPDLKTVQHAGVVVACCGVAENLGRFHEGDMKPHDFGYLGSLVCNREVSAVTGACLLARTDVFHAVGGFDDVIAVGYGDVDLCLRVRDLGYRVLWCAHASLIHHESATRGQSASDPHPDDTAYFLSKWADMYRTGDPYFNPNFSSESPNWQIKEPNGFDPDCRPRIYSRRQEGVSERYKRK